MIQTHCMGEKPTRSKIGLNSYGRQLSRGRFIRGSNARFAPVYLRRLYTYMSEEIQKYQ